MNLDEPILGAAQVAELAQTEILNIHTWTTRGFADPYHAKPRVRRGGGRVRSYSIRDALRFFLMARLHKQYRTPLPQGLAICHAVFGEENFNPEAAGYLVIEEGQFGIGEMRWYQGLGDLKQHLEVEPLSIVINVKRILNHIASGVRQFSGEPNRNSPRWSRQP
jgi:hypothetical protein